MSAVRRVVGLLVAGIISGWSTSVAWSQCLSVTDVQTRIDRARQTPTGVTAQLFANIRQQLIRNQCPADTLLARPGWPMLNRLPDAPDVVGTAGWKPEV